MTHNFRGTHHPITSASILALSGLVLLLMCFLTTPILAANFVDYVNGEANDFSLNGKEGKVKPGFKLNNGDIIKVLKNGSSVDLMVDGGTVTITYSKNNPCTIGKCTKISKPEKVKGVIAAFWDNIFGHGHEKTHAATRSIKVDCQDQHSQPLDIPMLKKWKEVKLLEGYQELFVGWKGGHPPYEVYLYLVKGDQKEEKLHKQNNGDESKMLLEVNLGTHNFIANEHYQIKISFSSKCGKDEATGSFTVVPRQKAVRLNDSDDAFERAFFLAKKAQWGLEAYQEIYKNPRYSAKLVRLAIAEGSIEELME